MRTPVPIRALGLILVALPAAAQLTPRDTPEAADQKLLLEGVRQIASPGVPGSLAVYGKESFPLVIGKAEGARAPVIAAGRLGKGRIVAFGHDGYFRRPDLEAADTPRLLKNALIWAAGKPNPRVAVARLPELLAALKASGVDAQELPPGQALAGVDVLALTHNEAARLGEPALKTFVENGGGLLAASTGWGWAQITGKTIRDHPLSAVTAPAGIVWTSGTVERTTPAGFTTTAPIPRFTHAGEAIAALVAKTPLEREDAVQAATSALLAVRSAPYQQTILAPPLRDLRRAATELPVPTEKSPVTVLQPLARVALALEVEESSRLGAMLQKRHPAANDFPGAPPVDARRVSRQVSVDLSTPGWHSTGLYAAPADALPIRLPQNAPKGLEIRIGAHTDENWHHTEWKRAPAISRLFSLATPNHSVGSSFGGLVYVVVPPNAGTGNFRVPIGNGVEAPLFRLGETDPEQWRTTNRNHPAPWAELAGERVIFTVPSSLVRALDDPTELMTLWDRVVQAQENLVGLEGRQRPERIVADRQISAGYMHAGYPIMVPIDGSATLALDAARLRKEGSWGHFHELGHNLQSPDWTFNGTGEVTNNVLAMYVYSEVLGLPFDSGHPAIRDPRVRRERLRKYLAAGARFDQWKNDPFLALTMYIQLIEAFGWDPYRKVFAEYRALPAAERPRTDEQKRDQWLIRMSRATGKNLGPFFQAWGVPTTEAARSSVRDLPTWMPADFPAPTAAAN